MAPAPKLPENQPAPMPPADEPSWAVSLRDVIEQLPSKLQATLTEDDHRSIAEHVHGLFEASGAFASKEDEKDDEDKDEEKGKDAENPTKDDPPQARDSLARRWFGAH